MKKQYHTGRIYIGNTMIPLAIWNGEKDYRSLPPNSLINTLPGAVHIVQLHNNLSEFLIKTLINAGANAILIWARDHKAYHNNVAALQTISQGRLQ